MNVLFITLYDIQDIDHYGIYEDLLREFAKNQHQVYVVSPIERKNGKSTHIIKKNHCQILKVRTGNIQKTNIIEKGISTVMLEFQFVSAIRKHYRNIKFDLVLYSTPPITVAKAIEFVKKRDGAKTYLLLKDIFPQNAVDIGMMSPKGLKGLLYRYFRNKEKKLYALSDYIGCMSQANVDYLLNHNLEIAKDRVEICPNSIEPRDLSITGEDRIVMRKKYGIPIDKKVFIYGGNLGKPQGIPFIIECLKSQRNNDEAFFLIVGSGTEYEKFHEYIRTDHPQNVRLMSRLPKEDYDRMTGSCDIGLIFLDHRFTIPNFPSRLLTYMQAKMPVLAVTDPNTDIGEIVRKGNFGWWAESSNVEGFQSLIYEIVSQRNCFSQMGENAMNYLRQNYSVKQQYEIILQALSEIVKEQQDELK